MSQFIEHSPSASEEGPLSREDCIAFVRRGEKPREAWKVGTEHEKIGVYADDFSPVPFEGPRGIGAFLLEIAAADAWEPIREGPNVIALMKEGARITLEPGGQLELSGAPLRTIYETCEEFHAHLRLVESVSKRFGIIWLALGIRPHQSVSEVPKMPKQRYVIMRDYLPSRGVLALEMMHLTATVQANFDFSDEADMRSKMQVAMGVTPIVSALFANSSIAGGRVTGYASRRVRIWQETDPDRCGLQPFVFAPDFGYADYVDWALDIPMFFIVRGGNYLPLEGMPFRTFLEQGYQGHRASVADFELHLTTLFPEVRLKQVIEVRGADAVPSPLTCALPALWKGLLYDPEARAESWELVHAWSFGERVEFLAEAARAGLAAKMCGSRAVDLASALVDIAERGLERIGDTGRSGDNETSFLEPLRQQLRIGKSPGEWVRAQWEGPWKGSLSHLIDYARYC